MKIFVLIVFNFVVIGGLIEFFERDNKACSYRNEQYEKAILKNQESWFRAQDYMERRARVSSRIDEVAEEIRSNRQWLFDVAGWINQTPKTISLYELSVEEAQLEVRGLAKSNKALESYVDRNKLKLNSQKMHSFEATGAL